VPVGGGDGQIGQDTEVVTGQAPSATDTDRVRVSSSGGASWLLGGPDQQPTRAS
jgi:hypothetical protein